MKTKEKILREALKQFNGLGLENVTTRHIASGLGMSQGNLHYHFANRDLIINELFKNFAEEIDSKSKYSEADLFKKQDVLLSMKLSYAVMFKYRFLFRDNETVWRRVASIKKGTLDLLGTKRNEIMLIIASYKKIGIFRSDISNSQLEFLAEQFIFNISSWLNAAEYLGIKKQRADYFAKFTFRQWLPYLMPDQMKEWEELLNKD